jgi:rhodanese-related sulfurtransferase
LVIDVRRAAPYAEARDLVAGALRRDPDAVTAWSEELPSAADIVVYCVHGHQVSQNAAQALRDRGFRARYLDHGIEGWREHGGKLRSKPNGNATRWVTRERPKIDRIACPWLVTRFVDRNAEFLYVPVAQVNTLAREHDAIAFDVEGAEFGHTADACSFDAFIERFHLVGDPALGRLATIVRAADTGRLEQSREAPGLLAVSLGLSRRFPNDHEMLRHGLVLYDALYLWCQSETGGGSTWRLGTHA